MRKLLLISLSLMLFVACGPVHSDLYLEAKFHKLPNGTTVKVTEIGEGEGLFEKEVTVKGGKVILDLPQKDYVSLLSLGFSAKNGEQKLYFLNENQPVKIKVFTDSINSSEIKGGEGNEQLTAYMHKINEGDRELRKFVQKFDEDDRNTARVKNQIRIKDKELKNRYANYRKEFIAGNKNKVFSFVAYNDLIESHTVTVSETRNIFVRNFDEIKETPAGKLMGKEYTKADPLALGNKAPSFSAPTPDGQELSLEEALGKYTLVDFWAAWCMPCRRENPNLVRVYEKYQDKGFTILGVSLDRNKGSWVSAIEKDGLVWNQISNLQFWQDPIAKEYKIRSIPASFLLDENGVIIAKNLRGKALENKIGELLGD